MYLACFTAWRFPVLARDIRMNVTAKTAPEPRVMSKFSKMMKEFAAIAPNLLLPQSKLRQAVWYECDEVDGAEIPPTPPCVYMFCYLCASPAPRRRKSTKQILATNTSATTWPGTSGRLRHSKTRALAPASPLPCSIPPGGRLPPSSGRARTSRGSMILSSAWTLLYLF